VVVNDLDIHAVAGHDTAHDIPVSGIGVSDGFLTITTSVGVDNPKLSAFRVVSAGTAANEVPVVNAGPSQTVRLSSSSPWTPAKITCAAWYDAADTNTITLSSGAVSQWNDKSGNARNMTQGTPANRPTFVANFTNDLASALFDGTDSLAWTGGSVLSFDGIQVAFVGRQQSGGAGYSGFIKLDSTIGGSDQFNIRENNASPAMQVEFNTGAGNLYGGCSKPSVYNTLFMCSMSYDGAMAPLYVNGGDNTAAISTNGTMDVNRITMGGYNGFVGHVGEMIVVRSTASDIRLMLEGYLAHKWDLQGNLPGNHPYKSSAPGVAAAVVTLQGTASDPDGNPLTTTWSVVSPTNAAVTFGNVSVTNTTATFTDAGIYILRLTASDSYTQTVSQVTITVGSASAVTTNYSVPHVWLDAVSTNAITDYEEAALADPDDDGFTTWQEYWSGTDPLNVDSFLKLDSIEFSGTNVVLKWSHALVDGGLPPITIQARSNLVSGMWGAIGTQAPTNGVNTWSAGSSVQGFYRLSVTNSP